MRLRDGLRLLPGPLVRQDDHLQAPDEQRLSELRAIFREQIEGLQAGGVELLIFETFSSLPELRQAVLAAKEVGGLPIIAQMSFYEDGHTLRDNRRHVWPRCWRIWA